MTAVAVNVTLVPAQIVVADAAMLTEGVTGEVTAIAITFDVAVGGTAQLADEVMMTLTTSLLANDAF